MAEKSAVQLQVGRAMVSIDVPPEMEQGTYANVLSVGSTEYDFVLTFAQATVPREGAGEVNKDGVILFSVPAKTRIVLPALLIPRVLQVLQETFEKYVKTRGIQPPEEKGAGKE